MAVATFIATLHRLLPQILPARARAVTLGINSWLVTVRVFMDGPVTDDAVYDDLERQLEPMLADLGPRDGEPWQLHLMLVRQDSPDRVRALGEVVWHRLDTIVEVLGPLRTARVELVRVGPNPPPDHYAQAGDRTFQVCRASVDVDHRTARVAMFWPADGEPTSISFAALTDAMLREPSDALPVVVRASKQQTMVVETAARDAWQLFAVAAVAAVARLSWAWDDCPVAVTVNDQRVTVDAWYTGQVWRAVERLDASGAK